jgi:hypothetical protein
MATIHFRGTRQDVRNVAYKLRAILAGRADDPHRVGYGFLLALGFGALSDIKDAYVTKADGGTDEMGISWPDLTPETKAYGRRFGPGEQSRLKGAAGLGRQNRFAPGQNTGLLTAEQLKKWKRLFAQALNRLRVSLPEKEAKERAAQIAWAQLKREGAQTKLQVYGSRKVQVLRDTGVLLNSLSPGVLSGQPPFMTYTKPSGDGGDQQEFEVSPGRVSVGTNVPYAAAHQNGTRSGVVGPHKAGVANRGAVRRQILPDNEGQIPDVWWQRWLGIANGALQAGAEILFREAA